MKKEYSIMQDGKRVGVATAQQEGMFWRIHCRCDFMLRVPMKIIVNTKAQQIDLGICICYPNGCGLSARIPAKIFALDDATFLLETASDASFIPIDPTRPFQAVERLIHGKFLVKNGVPGIQLAN